MIVVFQPNVFKAKYDLWNLMQNREKKLIQDGKWQAPQKKQYLNWNNLSFKTFWYEQNQKREKEKVRKADVELYLLSLLFFLI